MKVVLLRRAAVDLRWFALYYAEVFPEGSRQAARRYKAAVKRLSDMPRLGRPADGPAMREFTIARTPFSLIYRIRTDQIEIVRIWDARKEKDDDWLGD